MKKEKSKFMYSGKNSKKFWEHINSQKGMKKKHFYALGVLLQDIEYQILAEIYGDDVK